MRKKPKDLVLSDKDLRLLCSSLDKRIKRLLQVRGKLSGIELKNANECLDECNDLLYRIRMWRRAASELT